jgi:enoyl-CoA hydratase/carnithine racemase
MSWTCIRTDPFAILTLSAPPANNVSLADLAALEGHLLALGDADDVKVVVLTGDPPGTYLGHADLGDIAAVAAGERGAHPFERWVLTPLAIEDAPQPVIAAIDAPARGGGCELSLACTFRVGSPAASFTQHEVTRGAMPGAGATQRMPRLIGLSRAARMLMTGETVAAEEALRLGLLDHIVHSGDFIDGVLAWAEPLARQSRSGLAAIKRAIVNGTRVGGIEGLVSEHRLFHELLAARRQS